MNLRHRAFSLIELATALSILGSLAVLGTQLFRNSLRLAHESVAAQEMNIRTQSAITTLREDVWDARELTAATSNSLRVAKAAGNSVEWSIDGGNLVRIEEGRQRRWAGVGEGCRFEVDGPSLILRSSVHGDSAELRLVSQLQLASRELQ